MKFVTGLIALIATLLMVGRCPALNSTPIGVTCGWNYNNDLTGPSTGTANTPLFNPISNNPNATWDDWAEEAGSAQIDFIMPNLRGSYPATWASPTNIAPLITALNNRGLSNRVKLAIFDDNASSWTAQWNMANGRGFGAAQPFDISNSANWVYLWDYNYKLFYQTVPDANRFKINGRPVIIIWSSNPTFVGNSQGNISRALLWVRQQCQAQFGFNPFIIVGGDFLTNDTTCNDPSVIDGTENWFSPDNSGGTAWGLTNFNNTPIGSGCAGFQTPSNGAWVDPNHGVALSNGLSDTEVGGAVVTFLEGFTDWEEDAALFRVRNLDSNGNALGYSSTYYDYPNQRLNIIRRFSRNPFPTDLKEEIEACDYFGGGVGRSTSVNFYRNGPITIEPTTDTGGGYDVGAIVPGQWFEWEQVGIQGTPHFQVRVATITTGCQLHFVIDGVTQPIFTLPNTGGWQNWTTVDAGTLGTFATNSYHTIRLVCDTANLNLNYWQISGGAAGGSGATSGSIANGNHTMTPLNATGSRLDASGFGTANGTNVDIWQANGGANQTWTFTKNNGGSYLIQPSYTTGLCLDVVGAGTANGTRVDLWAPNGGSNQQWTATNLSGNVYTFSPLNAPGECLDVTGGSSANGTNIEIWSANGGTNQEWVVN